MDQGKELLSNALKIAFFNDLVTVILTSQMVVSEMVDHDYDHDYDY